MLQHKMKNGSIASLFRKHEEKIASRAPPNPPPNIDEELSTLVDVVDDGPTALSEEPIEDEEPTEDEELSPVYDVDSLENDLGLRVTISSFEVND